MVDPGPLPERIGEHLAALGEAELVPFGAWPDRRVPLVAAGAYAVWRAGRLVYAGAAGKGMAPARALAHAVNGKRSGLAERLTTHAAGRRAGDPFCLLVADRLVLPELSPAELQAVAAGTLSLDARVRELVRRELAFRYVVTRDGGEAVEVERAIRGGALGGERPLLNPL